MKTKKVGKFTVYYRNQEELARIVDEVFGRQEYTFTNSNAQPFIVDCGSHIGISILYFKSLYPDAEIVGFEPNPENFNILQKNLFTNNITRVRTINAALSSKNGKSTLKTSTETTSPWTWGDTIIDNLRGDDSGNKLVEVRTVRLSSYLDKPVDFLKIDVEGSEQTILTDIKSKLQLVDQVSLEFHDTPTAQHVNSFEAVVQLLEESGFKTEITARDQKINFFDFAQYMRGTMGAYCVKCSIKARRLKS